MQRLSLAVLGVTVGVLCAGSAFSQAPDRALDRDQIRNKILEKFDADKDGKLSQAERQKLRSAIAQRRLEARRGADRIHRPAPFQARRFAAGRDSAARFDHRQRFVPRDGRMFERRPDSGMGRNNRQPGQPDRDFRAGRQPQPQAGAWKNVDRRAAARRLLIQKLRQRLIERFRQHRQGVEGERQFGPDRRDRRAPDRKRNGGLRPHRGPAGSI